MFVECWFADRSGLLMFELVIVADPSRPSKVRRRMLTEQGSSQVFAPSDPHRRAGMRRQRTEQRHPLIVLPHFQPDAFFDAEQANLSSTGAACSTEQAVKR